MKRCEKEWGPRKSPHICDLAKHHAGPCRCTCDALSDKAEDMDAKYGRNVRERFGDVANVRD